MQIVWDSVLVNQYYHLPSRLMPPCLAAGPSSPKEGSTSKLISSKILWLIWTTLPRFEDYEDDKMGERILKSGRAGFVGWMGFGGSVMQWHPDLDMGFGYTCSLLTWWDLANTKARKLQKEAVKCAVALRNENFDVNNNKSEAVGTIVEEKAQEGAANATEGVAAA